MIFAAQFRRTIERPQAAYTMRRNIAISVVRPASTERENEVMGKALDCFGAGDPAAVAEPKYYATNLMITRHQGVRVLQTGMFGFHRLATFTTG